MTPYRTNQKPAEKHMRKPIPWLQISLVFGVLLTLSIVGSLVYRWNESSNATEQRFTAACEAHCHAHDMRFYQVSYSYDRCFCAETINTDEYQMHMYESVVIEGQLAYSRRW
jgi:hypothetical protein